MQRKEDRSAGGRESIPAVRVNPLCALTSDGACREGGLYLQRLC
jgi:hypothetical protein